MILVEEGPSSICVEAKALGKEGPGVELISEELKRLLGQISDYVPILKLKAKEVKNTKHLPWVVKRMLQASKLICGDELTGLASVAGAIADAIRQRILDEGHDFVFVNNGGDISLYSAYDSKITTGIFGLNGECRARIEIQGPFDIGIATSGFGGRSFTKGIADSVTIIAGDSASADAAATFIANHVNVDSIDVKRILARDVDISTDISSELVTLDVGTLTDQERLKAIQNGISVAKQLIDQGYILGFIFFVQGEVVYFLPKGTKFKLEVKDAYKKDCNDSGGDLWRWGKVLGETHQESGFRSSYQESVRRCI